MVTGYAANMLYALLALIVLGVWLFCLIDVLTTNAGEVRWLPKFGWFLVVLLGFEIGAVLWLVFGRPRKTPYPPATQTHEGSERSMMRHPSRGESIVTQAPPRGPDDDPEFLRTLERRIRGDE